jgi:hypothetical protein
MKRTTKALLILTLLSGLYPFIKSEPGEYKWEKRLFKHRLFFGKYEQIERRNQKLQDTLKGPFERIRIAVPFRVAFVVKGNHGRLRQWCRKYPNSYLAYALMGHCDLSSAWNCRGGGWAHETSPQQMREFRKWLNIGKKHLLHSYKLNPDFAYSSVGMITYCMGMGKERAEMEIWYERAQKADPWNTDSMQKKLEYLQPKWCGSLEEMKAFAYECTDMDAPAIFGARAVTTLWRFLSDYKQELLADKVFLQRAAYACKRQYDKESSHTLFLRCAAFFALHAGDFQLADELFQQFRWNKQQPMILTLWPTKADLLKDREHARKMAAEGKGKIKPMEAVLKKPAPVQPTPPPIECVMIHLPDPVLAGKYEIAGLAMGKAGYMAIINGRPVRTGDALDPGVVVEEVTGEYVDLSIHGDIYRFYP